MEMFFLDLGDSYMILQPLPEQMRFAYFSISKVHLCIFKRLNDIIKLNHEISLMMFNRFYLLMLF